MSTDILQAIRKSKGMSQSELARRSKTFQANISSIENGMTDPGLSTIEQCLSALGYSLIALPTNKPSVAQFSLSISRALAEEKEVKAFRLVIQLNDNLTSVAPEICMALSITPPPLTGDSRYDALLAGLVEFHLSLHSLPLPAWIMESTRKLKMRWIVDPYVTSEDSILAKTPKAFRRHNVLINKSELESS